MKRFAWLFVLLLLAGPVVLGLSRVDWDAARPAAQADVADDQQGPHSILEAPATASVDNRINDLNRQVRDLRIEIGGLRIEVGELRSRSK